MGSIATMTKEERFRYRRSQMVLAGVSNAQIARDQGVGVTYVYLVLTEQRTGYRIRRAIAEAVDMPVEELWPDTPEEYRSAA